MSTSGSSWTVHKCVLCDTFSHVSTVKPVFEVKNAKKSRVVSHGSVSTLVRALNEHERQKKTHRGRRSSASRTKREQRNDWYFSGLFAFAWLAEIMEQQVAALVQQVMEMSDRLRQSEEAAEQARQLLEAHRNGSDVGGMNEPSGGDCDSGNISSWWD